MSEITDELIDLASNYLGDDFFIKNEELINKYRNQMSDEEIEEMMDWYSLKGGTKVLLQFIDIMDLRFTKKNALLYVNNLFDCYKNKKDYLLIQTFLFDAIQKIKERIEGADNGYYEEILLLSLKKDCILVIQNLLEMNVDLNYVNNYQENICSVCLDMKDIRLKEYIDFYLKNHKIKEDCKIYFSKNGLPIYEPKYEKKLNDYFETIGIEDACQLLHSYNQDNLLNDETPVEELKEFIEIKYNWDDGVAIPYYIMKHKNCNKELRRELFELGAGDCLDRNIHSVYNKDPWERFIIELDDMINAEK